MILEHINANYGTASLWELPRYRGQGEPVRTLSYGTGPQVVRDTSEARQSMLYGNIYKLVRMGVLALREGFKLVLSNSGPGGAETSIVFNETLNEVEFYIDGTKEAFINAVGIGAV